MTDLITIQAAFLPSTIEDLSKFILIGNDKLQAVRAEISAIEKLGLAQEVHAQKLAEAQDIAEIVTLAKLKMGELLNGLPKVTNNNPIGNNQYRGQNDTPVDSTSPTLTKPKAEVVKEIGLSQKQAERLQQMTKNPAAVAAAMTKARSDGDIVSQSQILREINAVKKPHVAYNSGDFEWYTPNEYITAAREVMGSIDLDPASSESANKIIQASKFFTAEDDGLSQDWYGNIWLNPPYSSCLIGLFVDKLLASNFAQAIVLVNNSTDTSWFLKLARASAAIVFSTWRVKFLSPVGGSGYPLKGQAFLYLGHRPDAFIHSFSKFGWGVKLIRSAACRSK